MSRIVASLFPVPAKPPSRWAVVGRGVFFVFLLEYFWPFFTAPIRQYMESAPAFAHRVDLVFHEAGHVIFGVFGWPLLTAFGGTLGQVLAPLALALAFRFKNRDAFAAGIFLAWTGQSVTDCAPYINDARLLQLPLITGGTGREVEGHDWEFILTQLDLIQYDGYIARGTLLAGRVVMAMGFLWAAAALALDAKRSNRSTRQGPWTPEDDERLLDRLKR